MRKCKTLIINNLKAHIHWPIICPLQSRNFLFFLYPCVFFKKSPASSGNFGKTSVKKIDHSGIFGYPDNVLTPHDAAFVDA